jgi:outer membrane protein insertion porin family
LRLSRLGLFSAIDIGASERYDEKRDVYYTLKEAAAGAFEFGLGYGEYERYRGFFDISYRNFGGMNRRVSLRTELSTIEQRVILSFSEPRFLDKDIDFAAFLLHENKKELNYDSGNTLYRLTRETATVGIEKKLSPRFKGEFFYELSLVNTSDVQPDVILSKEDTGHLLISAIRPGIVYDTRDNPFDPREGVLAGISLKVASIALLSQTDFIKLFGYLNTYRHLAKRFVLAVSLRGGFAKGFRDTSDLPLIQRFFLGGRTTVRGYAQDSLGPKGADGNPTGGNTFAMGSVEIRTDLGRGFGIVTFLDAGNVWQNLAMNLAQTRFTTGLGLRYKTPVGPLRIDYGRKLSRREGESHGELHFSIGQAF